VRSTARSALVRVANSPKATLLQLSCNSLTRPLEKIEKLNI
jgi:hypothetical protein